jgi:hypothetical protein
MEDSGPGDAPQSRKRVESNGPKSRGHKPALDTRGFSAERHGVFTVIISFSRSKSPLLDVYSIARVEETGMSTQGPHTRDQSWRHPHICFGLSEG